MNFWLRFIFVVVLASVISLTGVALAKRPADQQIQGTHKLKIDGDFSGAGTAVVRAQSVTFSLKLKDSKGTACNGDSDEIDFGDGRFFGTLQLGGVSVEISGRVDLPKNGKKPRVTGFLRSSDGRVARIANSLRIAGSGGDGSSGSDSDDDQDENHVEDDHKDPRDRHPR